MSIEERTKEFTRRVLDAWPEPGIEPADLQDLAVECGVLVERSAEDKAKCRASQVCNCLFDGADGEDVCYVPHPDLVPPAPGEDV